MKTFKEFINEKNAQGNTSTSALIARCSIPLSTPMMDRLGYSYESEAYHVTSAQYLDSLVKMQGKKKQISAFTRGGYELMRLPSKPTILIKLKGNVVIGAESDMWTAIDKQGRRWINLIQGETHNSDVGKKLTFFINSIKEKIILDMGYFNEEMPNIHDTGAWIKLIKNMPSSQRNVLYKSYIERVEEYLQKDGYKLLNEYLKTNITYSYNEVVMNKFTILGAWSIDDDSRDVFIKEAKIKYLGVITKEEMASIS